MKIELKTIIERYKLDKNELSEKLFPGKKYPGGKLMRVLSGDLELKESQIIVLASIIGCDVGELFTNEGWGSKFHDGRFYFTNGEFVATLNSTTWESTISKDGFLIKEEILTPKMMTLTDYINSLNEIINTKNEE